MTPRPRSPQAEIVNTVNADGTALWAHRTEPVYITLNIKDILAGLGDDSVAQYDHAADKLERRLEPDVPSVVWEQYVWIYRQDSNGAWIGEELDAPPWTRTAWILSLRDHGTTDEHLEFMARGIEEPGHRGQLVIPKYPGALSELSAAEQAEEVASAPLRATMAQLNQQRHIEWCTFGEQLADRIRQVVATALPGLTVPVELTVNCDNIASRTIPEAYPEPDVVTRRLLDAVAVSANGYPTVPADLPGTPLTRLGLK